MSSVCRAFLTAFRPDEQNIGIMATTGMQQERPLQLNDYNVPSLLNACTRGHYCTHPCRMPSTTILQGQRIILC